MSTPTRTVIRLAMKRAGFTVSELARQAECSRPHLSSWLSGKKDLNVSTLERLMKVLGLKISP